MNDPSAAQNQPEWPEQATGPVVVLIDAASELERRMLHSWVESRRTEGVDCIGIAPSRRKRLSRTDEALGARLTRGDDPWVFPVRIAWLPRLREGRRSASWKDVFLPGDPRDPDPVRQFVIQSRHPERIRLIVGAGARASRLTSEHQNSVEVLSLSDYVARRAHRALERAERQERGNRYKVPKFLAADLLSRGDFRDGVLQAASEENLPPELAFARARYYLAEIAASHSPMLIDVIANAIHWLYRQGYGTINYDPEALTAIAALGEENPIAFLPSHRSNLDRLTLQYLLWENDLPPNHTAAGINMNFFPVGPLIRRTGAFFIRRSFKGKSLYRFVLKSYLDYLVEKRFPLEWYLEGGRSRSGKLLPPKYGMLGWVVDSVSRGRAEDLYLIPTSVAYDQIFDVADYALEASGAEKAKESLGWFLRKLRTLRRRYGNIHVRFGQPISLRHEFDLGSVSEEINIDLQKLAFEVMYRISRITPITPTAVVSIALLAGRSDPARPQAIAARAAHLDAYIEAMKLPLTEPLRLEMAHEVEAVLRRLADLGSVTAETDADGLSHYSLTGQQALQAAYYRNTVVHFFVPGAIAELALTRAGHSAAEFWNEVTRIRDLFKFDFFFAERETFTSQIAADLAFNVADWETVLTEQGGEELLRGLSPLRAHWAVRPFLESYQVVADELVDTAGSFDEKAFVNACLERARWYRDEGRISDESVSKELFRSALGLARNRRLIDEPDSRTAFADEITDVLDRVHQVADLAESALAGT